MKKLSLVTMGIGSLATCIGGAGLDGPTQVGCTIVMLTGVVIFFVGAVLKGIYEEEKKAKVKK